MSNSGSSSSHFATRVILRQEHVRVFQRCGQVTYGFPVLSASPSVPFLSLSMPCELESQSQCGVERAGAVEGLDDWPAPGQEEQQALVSSEFPMITHCWKLANQLCSKCLCGCRQCFHGALWQLCEATRRRFCQSYSLFQTAQERICGCLSRKLPKILTCL